MVEQHKVDLKQKHIKFENDLQGNGENQQNRGFLPLPRICADYYTLDIQTPSEKV